MRGPLDDFRELREPVPDDGALARGVLEDRGHVRRNRVVERPVQALGDRLEGPALAFSHARPGMEDYVSDAQNLGAIQFLDEGDPAVSQSVLRGRTQIDQIVGVDDRAEQSALGHVVLEGLGLLRWNRLRLPEHPRTPREDLDGLAADGPPRTGASAMLSEIETWAP